MINEVFLKALLYTEKKKFSQHNVYKLGLNGLIQMGWVKRGL